MMNSFFRFLLGFSLFIAASLGLTFAMTTLAMQKDKEEMAAAAYQTMLGNAEEGAWWEFW